MIKRNKQVSSVGYAFGFSVSLMIPISSLSMLGFATTALAAAKPAPTSGSCGGPATPLLTTPQPVRKVVMQPIGTKAFQLPNGKFVDLSTDLQSILNTAVTDTPVFSPTDRSDTDPCQAHLEIRSAVTNFQLNMAEVGVTFGYSPSGSIPVGSDVSVHAKGNVQIGTISMDFSVWRCSAGTCSAVAASTASQATAGVNLNVTVDFSTMTTGAAFLYNTPIGDALRAIMSKAMSSLAASPRINELPWQALVKDVNSGSGTLIFDEGTESRIGMNQTFEIYAPVDGSSTGICNVFQTVAKGHTVRVDRVSSTVAIDESFGTQGVHVGDVVMVKVQEMK